MRNTYLAQRKNGVEARLGTLEELMDWLEWDDNKSFNLYALRPDLPPLKVLYHSYFNALWVCVDDPTRTWFEVYEWEVPSPEA